MYKKVTQDFQGISLLCGLPKRKKSSRHFYATKMHGIVEVIEKAGKNVTVKFLDTNVIEKYLIDNVSAGKCKDPTRKRVNKLMTEFEDKIYKNKFNSEYKILWRKGMYCGVKFQETGCERTVLIANAAKNKVTDYFSKTSYGVGYLGKIGETGNPSVTHKLYYTLWHNMLKRCYCEKDPKGYYGKGRHIYVEDRWHNFTNFLEDITKLDSHDKWLEGQLDKSKTQYNLDKEFSYYGCTVYSKDTCQFIEESLNKGTTTASFLIKSRIENYRRERDDR